MNIEWNKQDRGWKCPSLSPPPPSHTAQLAFPTVNPFPAEMKETQNRGWQSGITCLVSSVRRDWSSYLQGYRGASAGMGSRH